jgi:hypothetical protein
MSDKTYVEGGHGIYYTEPARGPRSGKRVYGGRV